MHAGMQQVGGELCLPTCMQYIMIVLVSLDYKLIDMTGQVMIYIAICDLL